MSKRVNGPDLSGLHLGLEFVGGTLIFAGLGYWLDGRWDTSPWLTITGGALGLAGGMWLLIKESIRVNRAASKRFGKSAPGVAKASETDPEARPDGADTEASSPDSTA